MASDVKTHNRIDEGYTMCRYTQQYSERFSVHLTTAVFVPDFVYLSVAACGEPALIVRHNGSKRA
eukprot:439865-Amphidinium_carterae.1